MSPHRQPYLPLEFTGLMYCEDGDVESVAIGRGSEEEVHDEKVTSQVTASMLEEGSHGCLILN